MYILPIQIHMRKLQLEQKKKKTKKKTITWVQERFYGKTIGEHI